jgi:hypothetical protein
MTPSVPPLQSIDVASLASHLGHPRRPRLAEARAAVQGAASGEHAWHQLYERGLLPGELLQSAGRLFAVVNTEIRPTAVGGNALDLRGAPATVDAAVTLASDAAAMLEAEQLARMLRSRLLAWGAKPAGQVYWIVVTHQIPFSFQQGPAFNCALYSLEYALETIDVELRGLRADVPWLPSFVNDVIRADEGWAMAARESLEVPKAYGPPRALVGTRFETLENPFGIALRLWERGYILDHLCDDDRPEARLLTPMSDAPLSLPSRIREQSGTPGR